MKILVCGFEPFGGDKFNPSADLLPWLCQQSFEFELATALLPVSFRAGYPRLAQELSKHEPQIVVLTGFAKNRTCLTLERLGINWVDARICDNEGQILRAQKIDPLGADGIFTRLPLIEMCSASESIGISAQVSSSAGEFVCNYILYQLLSHHPGLLAGFIHLPTDAKFEGVAEMLKVCHSSLVHTRPAQQAGLLKG